MSSCLNQDIIFDIGKKLIEENDQEAVIRFGLSGREPLKALCKVFSTVTTLELYDDHYAVGWDDKICTFYFSKPHVRSLMNCVGGSVTKLRLDYNKESSIKYFQNLLKKIADMRQLVALSVPSWYGLQETQAFIQSFFSTLEHLEIDSFLMTTSLRDSLNLKCLTVLNTREMYFFKNCPKASTVIFKNTDGSSAFKSLEIGLLRFFNDFREPSPYLNTVKELVLINENNVFKLVPWFLAGCMQFLPSLEQITFKIKQTKKILAGFFPYFAAEVLYLHADISSSTNLPLRITYIAENQIGPYSFYRVPYLKEIFRDFNLDGDTDFEFDVDTVPGFYCFRKMIESAGTKSTLLEVQIPKGSAK